MIEIRCDGCNAVASDGSTDATAWVTISPLYGQGARHACSADCYSDVAHGLAEEMRRQRTGAMLGNGLGHLSSVPKKK